MKRLQEQALLQQEFTDLPLELQGKILAESFHRRINSGPELDRLVSLRSISTMINEMANDYLLSQIEWVFGGIIHSMKLTFIVKLTGLSSMRLSIFPTGFYHRLVDFRNLSSLKMLSFVYRPEFDLGKLTQLKKLNTRFIPEQELTRLTNLTELGFSHDCRITDAEISQLTNLTKLNLYPGRWNDDETRITPDCFQSLSKITVLHIKTGYPGPIKPFLSTWLRELEYHRAFDRMNDENIYRMTNLRILRLYGPSDITDDGLSGLISLNELYLATSHQITMNCIASMTNLTNLSLVSVSLIRPTVRPPLSQLTNLSSLKVSDTGLLNNTILCQLTNLTNLNLRNNKFISPVGISSLVNLKHINLRNNECITLDDLVRCTNLQSIKESKGRYYWLNGGKWNG